MQLYQNKPKRFFAFGCSFTDYNWATWANIIGKELSDIPFYNFGQSGAGNRYIATMVANADNIFNFNKDDLVIVCWTNIHRIDTFTEVDPYDPSKTNAETGLWSTPGNIYTNEYYPKAMTEQFNSIANFQFESFTYMKLVDALLQKTQVHHLQFVDQIVKKDIFRRDTITEIEKTIIKNYMPILEKMQPSFFEVLWNNRNARKYRYNKTLHPQFGDLHPTPKEHLKYLQTIFDYEFAQETIDAVEHAEEELIRGLHEVGSTVDVMPTKWRNNEGIFTLKYYDAVDYDVKIRKSLRHPKEMLSVLQNNRQMAVLAKVKKCD